MFSNKPSRYRNKFLKPNIPLFDNEVHMRQVINIDGVYYAIIMIGVMWLPDIDVLEPNPTRCVVSKVNPNNGELIDVKAYNVMIITT